MANPFLTPAPFDPRSGFGFKRPPVTGLPFDQPNIPGQGGFDLGTIDTPLGPATICMPGSHCTGPSISGPFGTSACLGQCVAVAHPDQPGIVGEPLGPPVMDPKTGRPVPTPYVAPKRKRMNYGNQRALRRALRRATGYARQQKSIRKAAGEFAREFGPKTRRARRDLPAGHTHVK